MMFSIWDDIQYIKQDDTIMPTDQIQASFSGLFPEWFRTLVMIGIAMTSNALVSLAKSKYAGRFVFGVWLANIGIAVVMAFIMDMVALWVDPSMPVRAEALLAALTGILAKDLLELAQHKGLNWIKWRLGEGEPLKEESKKK